MPFLFFSSIRQSNIPVKIRQHLPSFTFAILSPLSSSSSSFHSSTVNVISEFLLNECGFFPSQLTKVFQRRPSLRRIRTDQNAREVIHFLRDSGLTEIQLHKTIVRNPSILQLKVNGQLKLKIEFMKTLGFTTKELAYLVSMLPRILNSSLENALRPKICHLKNLFGSNVNLCKALTAAPELLGSDIEKQLKPKVEYVESIMGILQGSTTFVYALRQIVSQGFENVANKMKHMANLGLSEEEVHQIVNKHPQVLGLSTKKMQENIHFLIHSAGLTRRTLVLNPLLLSLGIEKRLKPHHEVFKSLCSKPNSKRPLSLVGMFRLTEKNFLKKFGQYNTQRQSH
ncbi:hypothetical protein KI387_037863 [Taxus chinensis]|uniref:Mitochondrial transcription termination factor n=1 Tax=Taxus chinensis TaxID=29808 RepID=A0AA38L706_TAXCH|nr:hypothetical protein KI387_037863 [Taxus chinensis]